MMHPHPGRNLVLAFGFAFALETSVARTAPAPVAEIPMSFDRAGLPMVEMPIDGRLVRFYLDIGTRGLHLPSELADSIHGLEYTARAVRSIDLAGKSRTDREFAIRELRMGGLVFRGIRGQELSDWGLGRAEFDLAVVGLDVLEQKAFVLDFPGRRLLLSDSAIPFDSLYPSARDVPFARAGEGLLVDVLVGGRKLPFVLDCASSISIAKGSAAIDDSLFSPCDRRLPGATCEMAEARMEFDGESIPLQLVRMPLPDRFEPAGIVGRDFFGRCAFYKAGNSMKAACSGEPKALGGPPPGVPGKHSGK